MSTARSAGLLPFRCSLLRHYLSGPNPPSLSWDDAIDALTEPPVKLVITRTGDGRCADTASREIGREVAAWTIGHYFQPVSKKG